MHDEPRVDVVGILAGQTHYIRERRVRTNFAKGSSLLHKLYIPCCLARAGKGEKKMSDEDE